MEVIPLLLFGRTSWRSCFRKQTNNPSDLISAVVMIHNRQMKNFFIVLAALLIAATGFGAEGTPVKNWQNVQTYDLVALQKGIAPYQGKVVGIRCNFRGKEDRK